MDDPEFCIEICYCHVRTYPLRHTLSHPRVAVQCLGKLTGSNLYKRKQPDPHMGALLTSHLTNFTNFAELFRIWLSGMWGLNGILLGLMNRIPSGEWWHRWWWLTCQKVTTVEQTTPEDDLWCTRSIILSTEPHSRNSRDHSIISAAVMETCSSTMDTAICSATLQLFCALSSTTSDDVSDANLVLMTNLGTFAWETVWKYWNHVYVR